MAIIHEQKSKFQKIKISQTISGHYTLHLDEAWQFNSAIEHRYHECIMTIPMCAAPKIDRILICGGGDGMALRESLRFKEANPVLVEIDSAMLDLFALGFDHLNDKSITNPRASVVCEDALSFAKRQKALKNQFDVIVLDFPSPTVKNMEKNYDALFSPTNFELFSSILTVDGVLAAQVSVRPRFLLPVIRSLLKNGYITWLYDVAYDGRGNHDSFLVASKYPLEQHRPIPNGCKFATNQHVKYAFHPGQEVTDDTIRYHQLFFDTLEVADESIF